jgi:hypothetical protein
MHPGSSVNDEHVRFYLCLLKYCWAVVIGFVKEVNEAGTKANQSKWRSACLDYHIALSLEQCAFTEEHQQIAQQKMNRTWAQFREKRAYKPIQSCE